MGRPRMARNYTLSDIGYYDVAAGKLATIVTSLEMRTRPEIKAASPRIAVELEHWQRVDLEAYRALYRHVGEDWLWCSRLLLSDDQLSSIVNDLCVDVYAVKHNGLAAGLLELDYRLPRTCEIVFFGLGSGLIGSGVGSWLMAQAIDLAWSRAIDRLWVHTCTLDHPSALGFYRRFGFVPFKQQV